MEANLLDDSVLGDADSYVTTPERITELLIAWPDFGVPSFIREIAAPFDEESAARFASEWRRWVAAP